MIDKLHYYHVYIVVTKLCFFGAIFLLLVKPDRYDLFLVAYNAWREHKSLVVGGATRDLAHFTYIVA